jgi:hypothetical protein
MALPLPRVSPERAGEADLEREPLALRVARFFWEFSLAILAQFRVFLVKTLFGSPDIY